MKKHLILLLALCSCCIASAQTDSIFNQGVYRTYIVHLPPGYTPLADYPLVLNFHGLGSNATEQQLYTQMDVIADTMGYIVVYPNGVDGQWNLGIGGGGPDDVAFTEALLDTLRQDFSIGNCWFSTGMSMGGFMTYKLACELAEQPTAIAVVTGNMTTFLQNSSNPDPLPVMHFHGTDDATVPYNGSTGVSPVENTMAWWADKNGCTAPVAITSLPNTSTTDNSTVELYEYGTCAPLSAVKLYKVTGGGHTWPGAPDVPQLGVTNHDISASAIMMHFFDTYCGVSAGMPETARQNLIVFPNPSGGLVNVQAPGKQAVERLTVHNAAGREIAVLNPGENSFSIDTTEWAPGTYRLTGTSDGGIVFTGTLVRK